MDDGRLELKYLYINEDVSEEEKGARASVESCQGERRLCNLQI